MKYPQTLRGDLVETLHGHRVPDPYRWLEDPDSQQTRAWVEAQRALTEQYLEQLPQRGWFSEVMSRVVSRPRAGTPRVSGGWYFLNRNDGSQAQDVWHVARSLDEISDPQARVIADPNTWSDDQTSSLMLFTVSRDGRYLAQAVSEGGSDWQRVRVVEVSTGERLDEPDLVTKFATPTWLPDSRSYLYNAFAGVSRPVGTETGRLGRARVMRHVLGTDQSEDQLVFELADDERMLFGWEVTDDDRWLCLYASRGTENQNLLWVCPLDSDGGLTRIGEPVALVGELGHEYLVVGSVGEPGRGARLLVQTDLEAPRGRIVSVDLDAAVSGRPVPPAELVPESADTLVGAGRAGETVLAEYLVDASARVRRFALDGTALGELDLPAGALVGMDASASRPLAYVGVSTVVDPAVAFEVDTRTGAVRALGLAAASEPVAPPYTVERHRATSPDGTKVPYFLITPAGAPTQPRPTLLYGYGGFKIPVLADYRAGWPGWLAAGGTVVIANLRGGGEYGTEWYEQGRLGRKQNVFDDLVAVAEHLVETGVTTPSRLAVHGRSNGGLLVGAVMTQRPDLFAAALPAVGVLDLLRFHKFTIGSAWISDYGDPDQADDFEVAYRYSPLHNVREGTSYPPTLVATGDHDDRVVPLHSHKFTAALQHAQAGENPVLTRIEVSTGHGAGKPSQMLAAEWADLLAFAAYHTGLHPAQT
mgnify:CR=1 FL=1